MLVSGLALQFLRQSMHFYGTKELGVEQCSTVDAEMGALREIYAFWSMAVRAGGAAGFWRFVGVGGDCRMQLLGRSNHDSTAVLFRKGGCVFWSR